MGEETARWRYTGFLTILIMCALLLTARLMYLFLADPIRFPIGTVKIVGTYQHVARKTLESVLSSYLQYSFFSLPIRRLNADLRGIEWTEHVLIERIWPDTLKITLVEKTPVATWNNALMTAQGHIFNVIGNDMLEVNALPHLQGPEHQQLDVLQNYQKLSKLLSMYGLHAASLQLRDNQAWDLTLNNGIQVRLGKRDLEKRLQRFCQAFPMVFADKPEQLSSVDLRYAHGMAVQWKQQMRR